MAGRRGHKIDEPAAAVALFAPRFVEASRERLYVAYLDAGGRVIGLRHYFGDGEGSVEMPVRAIVRDALVLDGRAVLIAHNHPSGDPGPSAADVAATRTLAGVLKPLGVALRDHLIFGDGGRVASFRSLGLI